MRYYRALQAKGLQSYKPSKFALAMNETRASQIYIEGLVVPILKGMNHIFVKTEAQQCGSIFKYYILL